MITLRNVLLLNQLLIFIFLAQTIDEFGYAVTDIITEISKIISKKKLPDQALAFMLGKLSDIEMRLSHGANEKMQLGALVGAFVVMREMMS